MDFQQPPKTPSPDAPPIPVVTPAEIASFRQRWTRFLFGDDVPVRRPPLQVREVGREIGDGIERLRITYETEPGRTVPAYVLRPRASAARSRPGVVVLHPTTPDTIDQSGSLDPTAELHFGAHLARRGYVAICPKCFIFGDQPPADGDWWKHFGDESRRLQARRPAWTGMAKMIWDGSRAVDVLASLPGVDPGRLGCIGHSLGAKEALFLAAFDPRLQASVSSDGGIGLTFSNWQDIWYLGPACRAPGFDLGNHQVLSLIAPRAFLLAGGEYDDDRAWPFIAAVLPLWRELGAPGAVGWYRHPDGHRWSPTTQEAGYAFLDRYLKP